MSKKLIAPNAETERAIEVKLYETAFFPIKVHKEFTNHLLNLNDFCQKLASVFDKIITEINGKKFTEIFNDKSRYHCHRIEGEEKNKYKKIINELVKTRYCSKDKKASLINQTFFDSENVYQIGIQQVNQLRFIGILNDNIFGVVFIDFHHLIYPSDKYNKKDVFSFTYDPFIFLGD